MSQDGKTQVKDGYVEILSRPKPIQSSQERIEETALEGLIKKYTEAREFDFVQLLSMVYGKVLTDRETS